MIKERFSTTVKGVRGLGEWLADADVELVVMESTGVYWKPVFYGLEGRFRDMWLVNAHHVKNVPGRKTDMRSGSPMWPHTGWFGRRWSQSPRSGRYGS